MSDTQGIEGITELLPKRECDFSVSSLRADSLTPSLVEALWKAGQRTLAIAPEAGSILLLLNQHGDWSKALRFSEVNADFFVHRPKELDENLPWDFINHEIRKEHLLRKYRLALQGEESEICHVGECKRCGVCVTAG